MRPLAYSETRIDDERGPADRERARGLIASSALHLLVAALVVCGLPWLRQPAPEVTRVVPIDLVRLGEETASPSSPVTAPLPQEKAREIASAKPAEPVPVAHAPPPRSAKHRAEKKSVSAPTIVARTERKPAVPVPVKKPWPDRSPATKPQPLPDDDLAVRLERMAQLRQPAPPMPPEPGRQAGSGVSNLTATSARAARAPETTYGVKDFIRAQIERRWSPEADVLKRGDWVVAVRVVLGPDGSVSRAEIVDDPRYRSDDAYRDFARSARNAVLLSSPITVPPGAYDIARDMVLDFDARQILR